MKRIGIFAAILLAAVVGQTGSASASASRTFVSGSGTDTGTCPVSAPCRSFAFALTQTTAGGEIVVLSSAGYGAVTIGQAVSITNEEGVEAALTVTSGDGITVAAGVNDNIKLTGLTLVGNGGANGITISTASSVIITNCVIHGFTGNGINFVPTSTGTLFVTNTTSANNGGSGVNVAPPSGILGATAHLQGDQILNNGGDGVTATSGGLGLGTVYVTVEDSLISGQTTNGTSAVDAISVLGGAGIPGPTTAVWVLNSTLSFNATGVNAIFANTTVYLGNTNLFGSTVEGYTVSDSAVIHTFGDNQITDTTNNGNLYLVTPR